MPTVATIHVEVPIGAENDWIGQCFRHPDQASVRDAHGNARVLLHQSQDSAEFTSKAMRKPASTITFPAIIRALQICFLPAAQVRRQCGH